jgi:hypothetical protein
VTPASRIREAALLASMCRLRGRLEMTNGRRDVAEYGIKDAPRSPDAGTIYADGPIDASVGFEGLFRVNIIKGFLKPLNRFGYRGRRTWVLLACKALRHLRLPQITWRSFLRVAVAKDGQTDSSRLKKCRPACSRPSRCHRRTSIDVQPSQVGRAIIGKDRCWSSPSILTECVAGSSLSLPSHLRYRARRLPLWLQSPARGRRR